MMQFSTYAGAEIALSLAVAGEGKSMVFQHGLCGDAEQPNQVFPFDTGYRCITLECRGHGKSEPGDPQHLSIATFSADVAGVIEAQKLGAPVVGGISMGAAIALRLAVTRPELVGALVLARPAWLAAASPKNMEPNRFVGQLLESFQTGEARDRFEASPVAVQLAREAPDNLASLRGFFAREPVAATAALLQKISIDGPGVSEAQIGAISVPTLVIGHQRDSIHPISYARKLADLIDGATFAEITPKADDAQGYRRDFRAALASFLKGL